MQFCWTIYLPTLPSHGQGRAAPGITVGVELCLVANEIQLQKTPRTPGALMILTSKSLSRAGVVQILETPTSKSAPNMQRGAFFLFAEIVRARSHGANFAKLNFQNCAEPAGFNDFDFQTALARRRGANVAKLNFQKCSETVKL